MGKRKKRRDQAGQTRDALDVRLRRAAARPVDAASLVVFRVAFGLIMAWEIGRFFANDTIQKNFVEPRFLFPYMFFEWVKRWPEPWLSVHFAALGVLALAIAVGAAYRMACILFFLGFSYVFLLDMSLYLNHFYLICLIAFILCFLSPHRLASIDARYRPNTASRWVPAWQLWWLRIQLAIVYFFGGVAKIDGDWLAGRPMGAWLFNEPGPWLEWGFREHPAAIAMAWAAMLFDLSLPFFLLWRRSRPFAFAVAVGFHVTNHFLFHIGIFPWFMIVATTLFFAPDWPRRAWRWLRTRVQRARGDDGGAGTTAPAASEEKPSPFALPGWLPGLLCIYLLLQIMLPLRHFFIPGQVNWTEEGHRFSWHMMLRTKTGESRFFIVDGHVIIDAKVRDYLTPRSYRKMSSHPDLLHVMAREIARQYREHGKPDVQVRVYARARLNRGRLRLLVDPDVNLGQIPRTLGHASWIHALDGPPQEEEKHFFQPTDIFTIDVKELGIGGER